MPRKSKKVEKVPEQPKGFLIGEALGFGWNTAVKNVGLLVAFLSIYLVLDLVGGGLEFVAKKVDDPTWRITALLFKLLFYWPIHFWLTTGFLVVSLKFIRGLNASFEDCFPSLKKVLIYFGGTLMVALAFFGGLLLFIIPGFVFLMRYQFAPYLMVDKELSLGEAFSLSARMTQGEKWHLFGMVWVCFGVLLVGLLACCIGVLWAWALVQIAYVQVYRVLLTQTDPELAS